MAALALAAILAACGGSSSPASKGSSGASKASAAASKSAAPVTVHLGFFPNITHGPALVGVAQGIFARDLKPDKLDASQTFSAGPAENQALESGSIDIAFEGPSSVLSAYSASHAVVIIAGAASGGAGLVTKASITSPSQLKGQTLASPQLANTQDVALRHWLKTQGYTATTSGGGEVRVQPSSTGNGTIVTEFKAGQIAGAWVPEPYESEMLADGGHLLVNEGTLWPGGKWATTNVVVRTAFLKAHPQTVQRFLTGLEDTLSYMHANPVAAQAAANKELGSLQGGKTLKPSVLSKAWSDLTFTADPLASTLETQVNNGVSVGLLKQPSNLAGIYDLGPLNSVLKARGQPAVAGL